MSSQTLKALKCASKDSAVSIAYESTISPCFRSILQSLPFQSRKRKCISTCVTKRRNDLQHSYSHQNSSLTNAFQFVGKRSYNINSNMNSLKSFLEQELQKQYSDSKNQSKTHWKSTLNNTNINHLPQDGDNTQFSKSPNNHLSKSGSAYHDSMNLQTQTQIVSRKKKFTLGTILNHFHHHLSPFFQYKSQIKKLLKQKDVNTLLQFLLLIENNPSKWIHIMPLNQLSENEWIEYSSIIKKRLEANLHISNHWDWTRISHKEMILESCNPLINMNFLLKMLHLWYPDVPFVESLFHRNKRSSQRQLLHAVKAIFENLFNSSKATQDSFGSNISLEPLQIIEEKFISLSHKDGTIENVQVDIFIPKYNLIIEYQGEQHYTQNSRKNLQRMEKTIQNDVKRRALFENNNIFYVEVPYWWDQNLKSLEALISMKYPFILPYSNPKDYLPIPDSIHPNGKNISIRPTLFIQPIDNKTLEEITNFISRSNINNSSQFQTQNQQAACLINNDSISYENNQNISYLTQIIPNGIHAFIQDGKLYTWNGDQIETPPGFLLNESINQNTRLEGILYSTGVNPHLISILIHNQDIESDIWNNMRFLVLNESILNGQFLLNNENTISENTQMNESSNSKIYIEKILLKKLESWHLNLTIKESIERNINGFLIYRSACDTNPVLLRPQAEMYAKYLNSNQNNLTLENMWGFTFDLPISFIQSQDQNIEKDELLILKLDRIYNNKPLNVTSIHKAYRENEISNLNLVQTQKLENKSFSSIVDFISKVEEEIKKLGWNLNDESYSIKAKSNLLEKILASNEDIYPSPEEQLQLSEILHEPLSQIQKILKQSRRKIRHFHGEITTELKDTIQNYLNNHPNDFINTIQSNQFISEICSTFNVGEKKVISYIKSLKKKENNIKLTQKQITILKSWIDHHSLSDLTQDLLQSLSNEANVSPDIVRRYFQERVSRRGEYSSSQRTILREWYAQHQYENLSSSEFKHLMSQTNLSASRIRSFIYGLHHQGKNELTDQQREELREYAHSIILQYESNENMERDQIFSYVKEEDLEEFSSSMNVSISRIKSYLYQYIQITSVPLSEYQKNQIIKYWNSIKNSNEINGTNMTKVTIDSSLKDLSKSLGVPFIRISHFLHTKQRTGHLNTNQKEILSSWSSNNTYESLTDEELDQLSQATGLNEKRARSFIYTKKSRELNEDQKSTLSEWIRTHSKYSELTEEELERLSTKLGGVIKSRIKRYIRDRMPLYEGKL